MHSTIVRHAGSTSVSATGIDVPTLTFFSSSIHCLIPSDSEFFHLYYRLEVNSGAILISLGTLSMGMLLLTDKKLSNGA